MSKWKIVLAVGGAVLCIAGQGLAAPAKPRVQATHGHAHAPAALPAPPVPRAPPPNPILVLDCQIDSVSRATGNGLPNGVDTSNFHQRFRINRSAKSVVSELAYDSKTHQSALDPDYSGDVRYVGEDMVSFCSDSRHRCVDWQNYDEAGSVTFYSSLQTVDLKTMKYSHNHGMRIVVAKTYQTGNIDITDTGVCHAS
jgi:hypothetical protein